jgi:hypothetical protein
MYTAPSPFDELTTHRLERPLDELVPMPVVARMRRLRLALMVGGAIGLIPWIVFLVITLPANYVALGFDVLLLAFMVTTAVLVFLRRQSVLLTAFTTGVLLICDAWYAVMTAGPHDMWVSALTATLVELPLAVILIATTLRILRPTVTRLWLLDPRDPTVAVASAAVGHASPAGLASTTPDRRFNGSRRG